MTSRRSAAKLDFEQVLRHYGVEVKRKGDQHHGYCPLPGHNGKKNSPSFSANLESGIFQCFGCGAKGNLLEFAILMEKLNPDSGSDVREVALKLQKTFCLPARKPEPMPAKQPEAPKIPPDGPEQRIVVNAPLDFELKRLEPNHPYLERKGLTPDTIAHFGLGFCAKGLLAGRIAIPIHRQDGKLLGYCGRLGDDRQAGPDQPKYKFPPKREREGGVHEFHKTLLVYNGNRIPGPVEKLAVVEGFPSVWWITQMGFPNVVAVMGSSCSEEQAAIIAALVKPDGRVWVVPDGDEAGVRCAESVLKSVSPLRFIKWLKLDEGKQPTDYPGVFFREGFR